MALTKHMGSLFIAQILGKQQGKKKTCCSHGSYVLVGEETVYQSVDKKISTGEEVKVESKRNLGTAGARKGKAT